LIDFLCNDTGRFQFPVISIEILMRLAESINFKGTGRYRPIAIYLQIKPSIRPGIDFQSQWSQSAYGETVIQKENRSVPLFIYNNMSFIIFKTRLVKTRC